MRKEIFAVVAIILSLAGCSGNTTNENTGIKVIDIAMDQFLEGIEPEIYCEELEASSFPMVSAYC